MFKYSVFAVCKMKYFKPFFLLIFMIITYKN